MLGAIIGDIIGSRFEWDNIKSKEFTLFTERCFPTDDSIMTLAVAAALLEKHEKGGDLPKLAIKYMQDFGRRYPHAGYGVNFTKWLKEENPKPYNSFGNGAAMRVSPCAMVAHSLEEALDLAEQVTAISHNHREGIKGAKALTTATYMAVSGRGIKEIKNAIEKDYYDIDFTLDEIRSDYSFDETCQGTVPQSLAAFFESTSYEDAIRNAISIGGDSDTVACITGAVAG
ncbi:MAG: ADP-ribosylglycohydrolase family protein, partial [Eubacteriales bacterium]|nr:ADP-ribosylglycohydrolase family protein [Eubacteriales bacterium]